MSTNFREKLSVFIFLILFMSGLFCTSQSCSVKAVTTSSQSATSTASKTAAAKSENSKAASSKTQSNSKSNSKENSNQSESLLPSDGNSLPPAAAQNWDQIMSDINNTADKDEFTFTEEPSHLGFFGSKLSYMGFGLILLSILGFTYFFYSTFFSKKSPRKLKKLAARDNNLNKNANNYYPNRQAKPRRNSPSNKSVYSDGYGYTRNPQQTRPVKKAATNNINKAANNNIQSQPKAQNNMNLNARNNPPKAKHMLEDDTDNVIMSNDNSLKNINNFSSKPRTNRKNLNKKNNKKDEFWNDFFLN